MSLQHYTSSNIFLLYDHHRDLHSFPTRRSSDLLRGRAAIAGRRPAHSPQLDRTGCSHLQCPLIQLTKILGTHNVWDKGKHDFIFAMLCVCLAKEIAQNRNLCQTWNAAQGFRRAVFEHPAKQIYFTFFEPNLVLNLSLSDNRLTYTADVRLPSDVGNIH